MSRLPVFGLRALALLLAVAMLWPLAAGPYNAALAAAAGLLAPQDVTVDAAGPLLRLEYGAAALQIKAMALHSGAVLAGVVVLSAAGVGLRARLMWLAGLMAVVLATHVLGMTLLAYGMAWKAGGATDESRAGLLLGAFASLWGLLPAVIAGAWCYAYWLPRASAQRRAVKTGTLAPRLDDE